MMHKNSFRRKGIARVIVILAFAVFLSTTAICAAADGMLQVTIEKSAQNPMVGTPVYLFNENGSYLGEHQTTDSQGKVAFNLTEGAYKIRVDYLGYQFWSPVYMINGDLSETLTVAHQDVIITVQGDYPSTEPISNIPVYLFNAAGSYLSQHQTTDANGQVVFNLPEQSYKVRADFMGQQFWSASFTRQDTTVTVLMADAEITVTGAGAPLEGVKVYVFTASGSYLSQNGMTNADGKITFHLPAGDYKFRADYQGSQYWSDPVTLTAGQVNAVGISTGGGNFNLTVLKGSGVPLVDANCYVFSESGSYLNISGATDASGRVSFNLAEGTYKIRMDYLGYQFWSPVYTINGNLIETFTIAHQDVTLTVQGNYPSMAPIPGVPVYLFTEGGAYVSQYQTTDTNGHVTFNLPEQSYKVRADFLGQHFWSDPFTWQNTAVTINQGMASVHVVRSGSDVANAKVYLFSEAGAYLGINQTTDGSGKAGFLLSNTSFKFRVDEGGNQYWSPIINIQPGVVNNVEIDISPIAVNISADPESIQAGQSSTLTWNSTGANTCVIDPGIGTVDVNGSMQVSPNTTTTYTITATGPSGTATASITITVNATSVPLANFSANPVSITPGQSSTLTWTSTNAQSAFIDNDVGSVSVNGSVTVYPEHTTTYTITVTGPTGSNSAQAKVQVTGSPASMPEGSFGQQYEDLIPPDATVNEYDTKRFSLITGVVHSIDDSPISGVSISLLGHPEYGTVSTDAQGQFSFPVDGGTTLTVVYQKNGFLTAQRKVYVPWNDMAIAETIQMIAQDPAATTVAFDGNPDTVVTHQSTPVTDEFGTREATMVFSGDNHAYLVDENGNNVQELSTITTRATEYTTPESMPAVLPPTSAYTYCTEFSVDGAQRVRFEKPVTIWVNNFLGFNAGTVVPVGYYDRDRGVWVPSENGVVVKLLDTNSDGVVDALDANGDNQPDDLNNNGSFSDEVEGLGDSAKYPPGSTFWRVTVTHFTPIDCNWPIGPPADAVPPNPKTIPTVDQQQSKIKTCSTNINSFIEDRSRIFHEDISIPGTDMTLHYASNRVEGYKTAISVPAIGDTIPASLKSIIVKVEVAGRTLEQVLDPLPNQKAEFIWDGMDYLGRQISGSVIAHISIGFLYDAVYYNAKNFAQAGDEITSVWARQEVTSWKRSDLTIYSEVKTKGVVAEGWTFSSHHQVSPMNLSTLYKGDGTIIKNNVRIIKTIVGNGSEGHEGDGGKAELAQIYPPSQVIIDPSGGYYIMEYWNHFIRYVDADGNISTIAGTGTPGYNGDGIPAVNAQLNGPWDAALDEKGNLYFVDVTNNRIRKIGTSGIISTVAGTGTPGYSGDGGPATQAQFNIPFGIDIDRQGNIYIPDLENNVIRKIDTNGIITTVAGNGRLGESGDGGPATQARLGYPSFVKIDDAGNLYISDAYSSKVRKVDTGGIITTVAGNGNSGYSGDGGPATSAELSEASGLAIDKQGNLYIADSDNYRIRKVDVNGIITTVAGNGDYDFTGDGGPAGDASFSWPVGVSVDSGGNIFIADTYNFRVRKIGPPSDFEASMVGGDIFFEEDNGLGYIMSSAGLHKRTIDLDTKAVLLEFGYDGNINLISITDQFGSQTMINRNSSGIPSSITSPDGLTTQLSIDASNHLTRITCPDGNFYSFEYTPDGLMTAETEPEGNRFDHAFNSTGNLTDVTDEEGGHWQFDRTTSSNGNIQTEVRTGEGNLTSYLDHTDSTGVYTSTITGPAGSQTLYSESADGLTVDKTLPCGMDLEFKYGLDSEYKFKFVKEMTETAPSGLEKVTLKDKTYQDTNSDDTPDLITETVKINNKLTTFKNNVLQSQKMVTSPIGRTITMRYDPLTLVTDNLSIPDLYDTSYGYDAKGRLTTIITNTRQTAFTYTAQGFLQSITDAGGYTTTYTHDPMGRTTGISRPDGSSIGFTYDKNGNMTVLSNPLTINHGFGYNKVNLNSSYQAPLSGSYTYFYDKDRKLKQINFPSGNQINNIYANGRLEQIQTPEGNIDYTYLCSTKVGSITKGSESIAYDYDGKLLTAETLSGTLNQTLGYTYNNDFNITSLTYAGSSENYTYDNDGLLTGAGNYTISRNAGNGLPETVTGGSLSLSRTFNGYGETDAQNYSIGGQYLTSWNLTRNNNGRITNKSETAGGISSDYIYAYDAMGRLLTVTKDNTLVEEYQYNANGTRIYEMNSLRGISGRNFSYDSEDHMLTAGSAVYSYNLDGFLTAKTEGSDVTTYYYSSRGELLDVTLPNGRIIDYVYDPLGRRIAKKVNGVITEKYLWQGLAKLLAVYDGSDNLLMRFQYADGRMPVAMTQGGVTYYLTYDQVGSLRIVADAAGNVVKRIDYDSFGNIIADSNPSFEVPFGFAGGLQDQDTGFVRFGFRDYDPNTGRWTAKDPILFAGGDTDLYGYCLSDPVNLIDISGLRNWGKIIGGGISIFGGIISAVAGGAVIAVGGAIEAAVGPVGLVFVPHTVGLGGILIGAGFTTGKIGFDLLIEGWNEDLDQKLPLSIEKPDTIEQNEKKPC